jgi:hypothetical protein
MDLMRKKWAAQQRIGGGLSGVPDQHMGDIQENAVHQPEGDHPSQPSNNDHHYAQPSVSDALQKAARLGFAPAFNMQKENPLLVDNNGIEAPSDP